MLVAASIPADCLLPIGFAFCPLCYLSNFRFAREKVVSRLLLMKNQSIAAAEAISHRFPLAAHTHIETLTHTHTVAVSFWHSLRRVAFHFNAKLMTLTLVHLPPLFIAVPHSALAPLTLFVISLCTHFSLLLLSALRMSRLFGISHAPVTH